MLEPWRTWTRHIFLKPKNVFSLNIHGDVKRMVEDYVGVLEDLDKAHIFEPKNVFSLNIHGDVKRIVEDYVEVLKDLEKSQRMYSA
jgi:hypothetical protein